MNNIVVSGSNLTIEDVINVARNKQNYISIFTYC